MSDSPEEEGFYWVILGQNPPEIANVGARQMVAGG